MDGKLVIHLDLVELAAALIEQVRGEFQWKPQLDAVEPIVHGQILDAAHNAVGGGKGGVVVGQAAGDALSAHFQQSELGNLSERPAGLVLSQRLAHALDHGLTVLAHIHVNEVNDDEAAKVAEPELPRHLVRRFKVGAQRGVLDAALLRGTPGVDIHRNQRLGGTDHQTAAGRQAGAAAVERTDLLFDVMLGEQRALAKVELEPLLLGGHVRLKKLQCALKRLGVVNHHLGDALVKVVAEHAHHRIFLAVEQSGLVVLVKGVTDARPVAAQQHEVALEFAEAAVHTCRADDRGGFLADQSLEQVLEAVALLLVLDALGNPAPVAVGHEDEEAPRKREVGGERRALVVDLVLEDLHQHLLPGLEQVVDGGAAQVALVGLVHLLVDIGNGEEAVLPLSVVHEGGLKGGLHFRDHAPVDVAHVLGALILLDEEVLQPSEADERDACFVLFDIDEHALGVC